MEHGKRNNKIYIWDIKSLVKDFKEGKVSQHEKMKYFFITSLGMLIILLSSNYLPLFNEINPLAAFIDVSLQLIIFITGFILVYKSNKSGDNKSFIDRFICLSFPIGVRLFVFAIILFIIFESLNLANEYTDAIIPNFISIIYYFYLRKYILEVAGVKK